MARVRVPAAVDDPVPGRPRSWPTRRTPPARSATTCAEAISAVIPGKADQRANRMRRGRTGGRPPGFGWEAYKQRNTVERCINRLKQRRGVATRYERSATGYLAGLHIAGIFFLASR